MASQITQSSGGSFAEFPTVESTTAEELIEIPTEEHSFETSSPNAEESLTTVDIKNEYSTQKGTWTTVDIGHEDSIQNGTWTTADIRHEDSIQNGSWTTVDVRHEDSTQNGSWTTVDVRHEDSTKNRVWTNSDASRMRQTDDDSGLQRISSENTVMMLTVAPDGISLPEVTSESVTTKADNRDKASTHRSVLEESTTGMSLSSELEPSESTVTAKTASSAFRMAGLETESETLLASTASSGLATTWSDGKYTTVNWDSESHKFSTVPVTTTSEPPTDLLSDGSQAKVTGTSDSLVANTTTSELPMETTGASIESEVQKPSEEISDFSSLQATVSEDGVWAKNTTTPGSISSQTAEAGHVATIGSDGQSPATRVYVNTTEAPRHALLSTSETARTLHTNGTGPASRPSFYMYSQAGDTVSMVTEVASKAPLETMSSSGHSDSPKAHLIGIVVGATMAIVVLVVILVVILAVIYQRKRRKSCYITDHDLKDYRSLMKRPHEPPAVTSPSSVQPVSPFSDMFPQDVASNGPPVAKYRMVNFDRNSDDGLDGIEIVHDDSREQRSPKEIPVQEFTLTPSGYSDCSYSVNTFRPVEEKSNPKSIDLAKSSDAETKFGANEASGIDEKAIEK